MDIAAREKSREKAVPLARIDGEGRSLADLSQSELRPLIERDGGILLCGFSGGLDGFRTLAGELCSNAMFNESPQRDVLDDDATVQSVNKGADPFPLHPELSREPWRPDVAMFTCIGRPGVGGQTNVCDGKAIVENLPPELRQALENRRFIYMKPASPQALQFWLGTAQPSDAQLANPPATCPYWFRRGPKGLILRGFFRPVFEPTLFGNGPAFANFVLFARDYLRINRIPLLDDGKPFPDDWLDTIRSVARRQTYAHAWQEGDVIILDNSRMMHGRRAIADADERQIATYFGYLKNVGPLATDPVDPPWRGQNFVPPDVQEVN